MAEPMQPVAHHDWVTCAWGVVLGMSYCRKCGVTATAGRINRPGCQETHAEPVSRDWRPAAPPQEEGSRGE